MHPSNASRWFNPSNAGRVIQGYDALPLVPLVLPPSDVRIAVPNGRTRISRRQHMRMSKTVLAGGQPSRESQKR